MIMHHFDSVSDVDLLAWRQRSLRLLSRNFTETNIQHPSQTPIQPQLPPVYDDTAPDIISPASDSPPVGSSIPSTFLCSHSNISYISDPCTINIPKRSRIGIRYQCEVPTWKEQP